MLLLVSAQLGLVSVGSVLVLATGTPSSMISLSDIQREHRSQFGTRARLVRNAVPTETSDVVRPGWLVVVGRPVVGVAGGRMAAPRIARVGVGSGPVVGVTNHALAGLRSCESGRPNLTPPSPAFPPHLVRLLALLTTRSTACARSEISYWSLERFTGQ